MVTLAGDRATSNGVIAVIARLRYIPGMGQMLIRNLDDDVIARLKARAQRRRTSAEEEARQALAASVALDREAILARLDAVAEMNGPQSGPTSLDILRSFRYPDGDD